MIKCLPSCWACSACSGVGGFASASPINKYNYQFNGLEYINACTPDQLTYRQSFDKKQTQFVGAMNAPTS